MERERITLQVRKGGSVTLPAPAADKAAAPKAKKEKKEGPADADQP